MNMPEIVSEAEILHRAREGDPEAGEVFFTSLPQDEESSAYAWELSF